MTTPAQTPLPKKLAGHFRRATIAGLLLLVPLVATYWVLRLLFNTADGILQPGVEVIFGRRIPGVGLIGLLVMVYIAGVVGSNVLGKQLVRQAQNALIKLPIVSTVYPAAKQLIESFSGSGTTGFKRVVVIEYPRVGTWTIGFFTGTTSDEKGNPLALIYIPTAPTPNSGWVAILPVEDVYDTDLSVPEALRLVLSGGIVAPPQIRKRRLAL